MFNRQGFNRGKFNRSSTSKKTVILHGHIDLGLKLAPGDINATRCFNGHADILLNTQGQINFTANLGGVINLQASAHGTLIRGRLLEGCANIAVSAHGRIVRIQHLQGNAILALTLASRGFNTFTYETISLTRPGFLFRVGDEIIIDMENMTVTQNGQNAMRFLDRESDFFEFNPGENEVTFETTTPRGQVDMRILWKDRWR